MATTLYAPIRGVVEVITPANVSYVSDANGVIVVADVDAAYVQSQGFTTTAPSSPQVEEYGFTLVEGSVITDRVYTGPPRPPYTDGPLYS